MVRLCVVPGAGERGAQCGVSRRGREGGKKSQNWMEKKKCAVEGDGDGGGEPRWLYSLEFVVDALEHLGALAGGGGEVARHIIPRIRSVEWTKALARWKQSFCFSSADSDSVASRALVCTSRFNETSRRSSLLCRRGFNHADVMLWRTPRMRTRVVVLGKMRERESVREVNGGAER